MKLLSVFVAAAFPVLCAPPAFSAEADKDQAASLEFTRTARPPGAFQLLAGDRVVFIGDTLIERAQASDYLETVLTARYPDRQIIFRNLGWSGDTPFGDARAGFGTAADGFAQLRQGVYGLRPTVVFVGYGGNSSFDGVKGLPHFEAGLSVLLDMLAATKAEIILLSPIRHEDLGRPLPDPARHNQDLAIYTNAIRKMATVRGLRFVDLFHGLIAPRSTPGPASQRPVRLTENGVHLTNYGYCCAAQAIEHDLALEKPVWELTLDARGTVIAAVGTKPTEVQGSGGKLTFGLRDARLPEPLPADAPGPERVLRIVDLPTGKYALAIDGVRAADGTAEEWKAGRSLRKCPERQQVEELRRAIVAKNRLYFYRWRPQNETYLFGFRKHEQGQNAREVPMYDPLVAEMEAKIAALRVPVEHHYELIKE